MKDGREDGWKDVKDVHDRFGEHEEHGQDGDDDIVVGNAVVFGQSVSPHEAMLLPLTTETMALGSCKVDSWLPRTVPRLDWN